MNRLEALQEIDRIEAVFCKPCPINGSVGNCEGCEHYAKIRTAGEALMGIANERRLKRDEELLGGIEWVPNLYNFNRLIEMDKSRNEIMKMFGYKSIGSFNLKIKQWQEEDQMALKLNGLTVDQYKQLKGEGKTDKEIREQYDITAGHFSQFKNMNKLVGTFNAHSHNKKSDQRVTKPEGQAKDYAELLARYRKLHEEKDGLGKELELTEDYNKQLKSEKATLENKLAEYDESPAMPQATPEHIRNIEDLKSRLDSSIREVKELEEKNEELQSDLTHYKTDNELLTQGRKSLESQNEELTQKCWDFDKKLKEALEQLNQPTKTDDYEKVVAEYELFKGAWHELRAKQ